MQRGFPNSNTTAALPKRSQSTANNKQRQQQNAPPPPPAAANTTGRQRSISVAALGGASALASVQVHHDDDDDDGDCIATPLTPSGAQHKGDSSRRKSTTHHPRLAAVQYHTSLQQNSVTHYTNDPCVVRTFANATETRSSQPLGRNKRPQRNGPSSSSPSSSPRSPPAQASHSSYGFGGDAARDYPYNMALVELIIATPHKAKEALGSAQLSAAAVKDQIAEIEKMFWVERDDERRRAEEIREAQPDKNIANATGRKALLVDSAHFRFAGEGGTSALPSSSDAALFSGGNPTMTNPHRNAFVRVHHQSQQEEERDSATVAGAIAAERQRMREETDALGITDLKRQKQVPVTIVDEGFVTHPPPPSELQPNALSSPKKAASPSAPSPSLSSPSAAASRLVQLRRSNDVVNGAHASPREDPKSSTQQTTPDASHIIADVDKQQFRRIVRDHAVRSYQQLMAAGVSDRRALARDLAEWVEMHLQREERSIAEEDERAMQKETREEKKTKMLARAYERSVREEEVRSGKRLSVYLVGDDVVKDALKTQEDTSENTVLKPQYDLLSSSSDSDDGNKRKTRKESESSIARKSNIVDPDDPDSLFITKERANALLRSINARTQRILARVGADDDCDEVIAKQQSASPFSPAAASGGAQFVRNAKADNDDDSPITSSSMNKEQWEAMGRAMGVVRSSVDGILALIKALRSKALSLGDAESQLKDESARLETTKDFVLSALKSADNLEGKDGGGGGGKPYTFVGVDDSKARAWREARRALLARRPPKEGGVGGSDAAGSFYRGGGGSTSLSNTNSFLVRGPSFMTGYSFERSPQQQQPSEAFLSEVDSFAVRHGQRVEARRLAQHSPPHEAATVAGSGSGGAVVRGGGGNASSSSFGAANGNNRQRSPEYAFNYHATNTIGSTSDSLWSGEDNESSIGRGGGRGGRTSLGIGAGAPAIHNMGMGGACRRRSPSLMMSVNSQFGGNEQRRLSEFKFGDQFGGDGSMGPPPSPSAAVNGVTLIPSPPVPLSIQLIQQAAAKRDKELADSGGRPLKASTPIRPLPSATASPIGASKKTTKSTTTLLATAKSPKQDNARNDKSKTIPATTDVEALQKEVASLKSQNAWQSAAIELLLRVNRRQKDDLLALSGRAGAVGGGVNAGGGALLQRKGTLVFKRDDSVTDVSTEGPDRRSEVSHHHHHNHHQLKINDISHISANSDHDDDGTDDVESVDASNKMGVKAQSTDGRQQRHKSAEAEEARRSPRKHVEMMAKATMVVEKEGLAADGTLESRRQDAHNQLRDAIMDRKNGENSENDPNQQHAESLNQLLRASLERGGKTSSPLRMRTPSPFSEHGRKKKKSSSSSSTAVYYGPLDDAAGGGFYSTCGRIAKSSRGVVTASDIFLLAMNEQQQRQPFAVANHHDHQTSHRGATTKTPPRRSPEKREDRVGDVAVVEQQQQRAAPLHPKRNFPAFASEESRKTTPTFRSDGIPFAPLDGSEMVIVSGAHHRGDGREKDFAFWNDATPRVDQHSKTEAVSTSSAAPATAEKCVKKPVRPMSGSGISSSSSASSRFVAGKHVSGRNSTTIRLPTPPPVAADL